MIYYLLLTYFAIRATQLLCKNRLITVLGINLNDPTKDSGDESAPFIPTLDSTKSFLEAGSDGAGNVGAQLTSSVRGLSGVTMYDMWRLTTSFSGNATPISSNLERVDTNNFNVRGTGMSQASGVFTFPDTGQYKIEFVVLLNHPSEARAQFYSPQVTTDGGTTWSDTTNSFSDLADISTGSTYLVGYSFCGFDVPDVSTHKVRFRVSLDSSTSVIANTDENATYFTFTRLGDL